MTRGQIAVVLPDGSLLTSIEFNGGMGLDNHGKEVIQELEAIESEAEFKEFIGKFHKEYYESDDKVLIFEGSDDLFDMSKNYFDNWFSDYVYVKNLSEKPVVFTDKNGTKIELDSDTVAVFYFGEFAAADEDGFDSYKFIKELREMKENLSCDMEQNYCDIWNACADYDNNHRGSYLTDRITEQDFIDEELLEYIVKDNATDVSRLRCFLGDTYDADIYKLDGYGNLQNVDTGDFEDLIDVLIENLQDNIHVPLCKGAACL